MTIVAGQPRYLTPINVFRTRHPDVPCHAFAKELTHVMDPATPTGLIPLDLGPAMELDHPATTPLMMTYYARIRPGERLTCDMLSTGVVYYVIAGSGTSRAGPFNVSWSEGDAVLMPPGGVEHVAGSRGAILFMADDGPALRFYGTRPQPDQISPIRFPAVETERQLTELYERAPDDDLTGKALFLSTDAGGPYGTITPSMVAVFNSLEPGGNQRPHRHNAAAITLALTGAGTFSIAGDVRVDWQPFLVMTTPPTAMHSIHNRDTTGMRAFTVQDSGLFFHARATGFAFG
jgi:gentisate 1,2-dioxygenase